MQWRQTRRIVQLFGLTLLAGWGMFGCLDMTDTNDAGTGGTGSGTLLVSNCVSTFTPCGGDVTGKWAITSMCAESNLVDSVNSQYRSSADCGSVCNSANLTASGSVTFSGSDVTSSESFRLVETLGFNDACFSELKGTTLTDSTCQSGANDFSGTASCALSLATCACQVDQVTADGATSYTQSGNQLVLLNSASLSQETVDYCVTGNSMTQRRNLPPGVNYLIQFSRQ